MNESALEGFVKIVEMNSFSAAADALYISQSALSQQIRTLEGQLKLELFQHVPRRVVLTPAGQDFYPQAKMILNLYQNAVKHAQAVQQHTDPPERHILIAYCHEALRMFGYDLFALTGELCIRFSPVLRRCVRRSDVWNALQKGDADLSFQLDCTDPRTGAGIYAGFLCAGVLYPISCTGRYAKRPAHAGAGAAIPLDAGR